MCILQGHLDIDNRAVLLRALKMKVRSRVLETLT